MEHKEKLEDLNKESLQKLDEYIKTKDNLKEEHNEQLQQAKDEWQVAWSKLMDTLMVLERLEI